MMNKTLYFIPVGLFLLVTACASKTPVVYDDLDTDANGYITKSEAKVRRDLIKNWEQIDKDGDGKVTVTEYESYEGKGRLSSPEDLAEPEPGAAPR